jgi:hypothetical protein
MRFWIRAIQESPYIASDLNMLYYICRVKDKSILTTAHGCKLKSEKLKWILELTIFSPAHQSEYSTGVPYAGLQCMRQSDLARTDAYLYGMNVPPRIARANGLKSRP